jgi:DNA (cytosine-5)-methyltransferase 1
MTERDNRMGGNLPKIVDIFCGAGGLSMGFARAGFSILLGVDNDERALKTYSYNHDCDYLNLDLSQQNSAKTVANAVNRISENEDVDVVIGGPPCQGFSQANVQTRSADNPLNGLARRFLDVVKEIEPTCVVLENVPQLLTMYEGKFKKSIVNTLEDFGYFVDHEVLSADDFGVPQARKRVFFIGSKIGPPSFPEEALGKIPTKNAIFDLPPLPKGGGGSEVMEYNPTKNPSYEEITDFGYIDSLRSGIEEDIIYNHQSTRNRERTFRRFEHIPPGGNWRDIPEELMDNYTDRSRTHDHIYQRIDQNDVSKTVANFRKQMMIHPTQDRLLSIREAARLQSFSDDYQFVGGGRCAKQQMVGNAVPVRLAEAVAYPILKQMASASEFTIQRVQASD